MEIVATPLSHGLTIAMFVVSEHSGWYIRMTLARTGEDKFLFITEKIQEG
jgi:hypothetical protein